MGVGVEVVLGCVLPRNSLVHCIFYSQLLTGLRVQSRRLLQQP